MVETNGKNQTNSEPTVQCKVERAPSTVLYHTDGRCASVLPLPALGNRCILQYRQ